MENGDYLVNHPSLSATDCGAQDGELNMEVSSKAIDLDSSVAKFIENRCFAKERATRSINTLGVRCTRFVEHSSICAICLWSYPYRQARAISVTCSGASMSTVAKAFRASD